MKDMQASTLPLGFLSALVQDKRAMQVFAEMGDREREVVLSRARQANSWADMQVIALSLSDRWSATEAY